jgi:hypothetical protein
MNIIARRAPKVNRSILEWAMVLHGSLPVLPRCGILSVTDLLRPDRFPKPVRSRLIYGDSLKNWQILVITGNPKRITKDRK